MIAGFGKRVVAGAMVPLVGVLGLAACGSDTSNNGSEGEIVIGAVGPLTGPAAGSLSVLLEAIKVRAAEVNDAGGIGGHQVKVVVKDDQLNPATTAQVTRQLVEDDGVTLMCPVTGTSPFAAVADYLSQQKVPTIPATGSDLLQNAYTWQPLPSYDPLGERLANYAVKELGVTKFAIAYTSDDVGAPFREGAERGLKANGLEALATVKLDVTATDYSSQAAQLKASGAEFVLFNHLALHLARLQNAALKVGYSPQWGAGFVAMQPELLDLAPEAAADTLFASPFLLPESHKAAGFRDAFAKYSPDSSITGIYAIEGYAIAETCMQVLEKAVEKAGGKVPTSAQVFAALNEGVSVSSDLINVDWSADQRVGPKETQILGVQDGKFVEVAGFATP